MTRAELPEQIETERLLLRVRTVADAEDIFDFASRPEVSYPAGFPPVKTLEDEIYYLEHILPERNQKDNLPAGYGIVVKGIMVQVKVHVDVLVLGTAHKVLPLDRKSTRLNSSH